MMMIAGSAWFSLLCILDFVKEIVEDLSCNPDRPPVPSMRKRVNIIVHCNVLKVLQ